MRTAYKSVISVMHKGCRLHIHPHTLNIENIGSWTYEPDWDKMYRYLEFESVYCKIGKYEGKCNPYSDEMKQWFEKKRWTKRLAGWGEMIVIP